MQSLIDSIKNELYEQLSDSIDNKFGIKKDSTIPHSEKLHVIFSTDEEVINKEVADRKAYLKEKYPDDDGSGPPMIFVSFTKPKPLPDENSNWFSGRVKLRR